MSPSMSGVDQQVIFSKCRICSVISDILELNGVRFFAGLLLFFVLLRTFYVEKKSCLQVVLARHVTELGGLIPPECAMTYGI